MPRVRTATASPIDRSQRTTGGWVLRDATQFAIKMAA